jgi:uncharacterized protein (TIGR02147 family)
MSSRGPIDIFKFLNYRKYLDKYYKVRKPHGFSYRTFSRRAGIASPNYLKLVIQGKRNLTPYMAERFAEACKLKGESAEYFVHLVTFNQAKTLTERDDAFSKLKRYRRYRSAQRLELAHAAYFSTWYLPAIREIAARDDFCEDPKWIAEQLWPSIKPSQASIALDTLLKLGLLERNEKGHIVQGNPILSTGPETHNMHVANYHRAMMSRASESIDEIPASQRDITSLIFCLNKNGVREIKERIREFRHQIIERAEGEQEPYQVLQLNIQLFPLSRGSQGQGEGHER